MKGLECLQVDIVALLLIILLCVGCTSPSDLLEDIEEYPIIITTEGIDRVRLDWLFAKFTATYGFTRPVERQLVLGTLARFDEFDETRADELAETKPDEFANPIPLEPTRSSWTEAEMVEATRQFLIKWYELLGLAPATLTEVTIFRNETLSNGAGWYPVIFKQRIDNYLLAPGIQCGISDDGFLWSLNSRIIPNVDLPQWRAGDIETDASLLLYQYKVDEDGLWSKPTPATFLNTPSMDNQYIENRK